MIIKGKGETFFETGTEGIIWSLLEPDKQGYEGLHCLRNGHYLKVFEIDNQAQVVWEGVVDLEYERQKIKSNYSDYEQQAILGYWVRGFQKDLEPKVWANFFFNANYMELIKTK